MKSTRGAGFGSLTLGRHRRSLPSMKKGEGCEIEARGLSYKIPTSKGTHFFDQWTREEDEARARYVLKNVSCRAKPWEILAVVGPSGAGKSTLLEILAGRLTPNSPAVLVDQKPVNLSDHKKMTGYVTQKDTLFPLLTVRETLLFSAKLRLGLLASDLATRVDALIHELGLGHLAGARVGDGVKIRGISGGERRRVSIGVDVVHDPRVLILDEPTSGLDSTSALQVVDLLKTMAETRGRTVVLSIHQPGFRIVKLFNSVLLLADGSVLHHGTVDQLQSTLTSVGIQIPVHLNVVEFAIDAIDTLQHQQQQEATTIRDRCTLEQLFQLNKVVGDQESIVVATGFDLYSDFANSWFCETTILTHRFLKNVFRTKELFAGRTIQMLVSGLVLGSIFYDLKYDSVGALERVGLFAFILTFLLSCTTEALPIFLQEREILMKETSSGSYRVSSYVVANGLVFLPFLVILAVLFSVPIYWLVGLNRSFRAFMFFLLLIWLVLYTANSVAVCFSALAPNFIVGNSLVSGVMGSFFLFSGYFISKEGMPNCWVFMHYISLFKYPFEGFLVNEFSGSEKCLEYRFGICVLDGDRVLREVSLGEESRWRNVVVMVCFILAYRLLAYLILRCRCRCDPRAGLKKRLV